VSQLVSLFRLAILISALVVVCGKVAGIFKPSSTEMRKLDGF
jgi:hypothetical protein